MVRRCPRAGGPELVGECRAVVDAPACTEGKPSIFGSPTYHSASCDRPPSTLGAAAATIRFPISSMSTPDVCVPGSLRNGKSTDLSRQHHNIAAVGRIDREHADSSRALLASERDKRYGSHTPSLLDAVMTEAAFVPSVSREEPVRIGLLAAVIPSAPQISAGLWGISSINVMCHTPVRASRRD